jgi:hypothetical protein
MSLVAERRPASGDASAVRNLPGPGDEASSLRSAGALPGPSGYRHATGARRRGRGHLTPQAARSR